MEEIGKVAHYFTNIAVAVIDIWALELKVGDRVKFSGHTTDFQQTIESMEMERSKVTTAGAGDSVAIKVDAQVRENDIVYRLT